MNQSVDAHVDVRIAGWREWVALPELNITHIKAKMDTGARTSCIHAFRVEEFDKQGERWVRFWVHPNQQDTQTEVVCEARVVDVRRVTDSGGHREMRYVIATQVAFGSQRWEAEITLTNRDNMKFRMLIGRTAMKDRIIINPAVSYQLGQPGVTE